MKQYFVNYKCTIENPLGFQNVNNDSFIYKSSSTPIEFFDDLKKDIIKCNQGNYLHRVMNIIITDLKCLGDFQTEAEKAIEKEAIGKIREEMHKSLR